MSYNPDSLAVVQQQTLRFARFLSQRELSLVVPVNFVTYPGVVLSAACFAHGRYEESAAAKCLSNLLATGFRRIAADLYWDASRMHWSLCPVELGGTGQAAALSTSISTATTPLQTKTQLNPEFITGRSVLVTADALKFGRQQTSTDASLSQSQTVSTTSEVTLGTDSTSPSLSASVVNAAASSGMPTSDDSTLFNIGPYFCSLGTDVQLLIDVMAGYLHDTENILNATTLLLTLNVHAAALASDPTGSARQPTAEQLPDDSSLLSNLVAPDSSVYLYTPSELLEQRQNLNASNGWFTTTNAPQPEAAFFLVDSSNGQDSSPDGWPSESYIELENSQRIMVGFGDIDPQMRDYKFAGDEDVIFPSHYLESPQAVSFTASGNITSGCIFNPRETNLASVNSSWAVNSIGNGSVAPANSLDSVLAQANNLTFCGISPLLNSTLNNVTADQDPYWYTAFVQSTVWSWGPEEPVNASSTPDLHEFHCAALDSNSGTWQAHDCGESRRGACRVNNEPYQWQITSADAPYDRIDLACDDDARFDTPRNSLENSYLLSVWRAWQADRDGDDTGSLLWLNFNDLDTPTCWVIGQNSTCPYDDGANTASREVIVPVVGAIVVLVLASLTVLVKCAGNRQQSKRRRRRADDGWDYEGVPS